MSEQIVGLNGSTEAQAPTHPAPAAAGAVKPTRGTNTSDPKLVACIRIAKMLDNLTTDERAFVLAYIGEKY